ncbi:MAG: ribonuclease III, partial [Betaproteobacteria bacterium]|nr:ribonuclease III [Betaproteobacteria bacterium]
NERLEFLGDAVLNLLIAQQLFERFPKLDEGSLSRARASLVRESCLADVARTLELGQYLRIGEGERRNGAHERSSLLADTFEACLGAIYQDGGLAAAAGFLDSVFRSRLVELDPQCLAKDHKTQLQEQLQQQKIATPVYSIIARYGQAHEQEFEVRCAIESLDVHASARGASKRQAEQAAAALVLDALQQRRRR